MLNLTFRFAILSILCIIANASEPYCTQNVTTITKIPVIKTRQVFKKPTGFLKIFKKTKYETETYVDYEELPHVKTVHGCCEGYNLSANNLCEPFCEKGCPKNAICVEPNICQCKKGYVSAVNSEDGSHYCEPVCRAKCPLNARCTAPNICECERGYHKSADDLCVPHCSSGCPFGGHCFLPEQCECQTGYSAELGTCLPICSAGDGCQNGKCQDTEICICNRGYKMDSETNICEKVLCEESKDCSNVTDIEDSDTSTTTITSTEYFENESTNDYEIAEKEKIFLSTPDTVPKECLPNFFFNGNACQPTIFASNEFDCRFKPCLKHAFCQANGTCACEEGYLWYRHNNTEETATEKNEPDSAVCLTPMEINALLNVTTNLEIDDEAEIDWLSAFLIALGVLCILCTLGFLLFKHLRPNKGEMDVEAKNDLCCTYDNKNEALHVY